MIRLGGITWILTYNCNLACAHCFFDTQAGGPWLDPALVDRVLVDCPDLEGMYFQHLSGGEIFLDEEHLFAVLGRIRGRYRGDIGLSTNGFWGDSEQRADSTVARLAAAGVTGVSVSADWYHSQWLDPAAPRRVAEAVRRAGIGSHSWLMGARLPEGAAGAEAVNASGEELASWDGRQAVPPEPGRHASAPEGPGLPPARAMVRSIGKGARCNTPKKPGIPQGHCTELSHCLGERGPFNPGMVWIDPYSNVSICHGIVIGNVYRKSFGEIIRGYDPAANPITGALAAEGPRGLHSLAEHRGLRLPGEYFDECDLCWTSRVALRGEAGLAAVLGPKECYPS